MLELLYGLVHKHGQDMDHRLIERSSIHFRRVQKPRVSVLWEPFGHEVKFSSDIVLCKFFNPPQSAIRLYDRTEFDDRAMLFGKAQASFQNE